MTKIELETRSNPTLRKVGIVAIGGLSLIFLSGVMVGFIATVMEHDGFSFADILVPAIIAGLIAIVLILSKMLWPKGEAELLSPSTRKSQNILWISVAVGVALGLFIGITEDDAWSGFFSNSEMPKTLAAVSIAVWLGIVPLLTWVWWRTVDEHEKDAYREGAMVSAHFYLFLVPAWWLAARAGWVPAQDPMIVLLIISIIWSCVWLYRKYF